ncbi:hypothetical protein [Nostoc sp.]|uniref:hypothetical protein n=1 Tax=Nostoc sp. TaxID=1180 RepID=UPI002FFCC2C1
MFQKINDPKPVIESEAKQSQRLGLLRFVPFGNAKGERNDNWAFFYLDYSYCSMSLVKAVRQRHRRTAADALT